MMLTIDDLAEELFRRPPAQRPTHVELTNDELDQLIHTTSVRDRRMAGPGLHRAETFKVLGVDVRVVESPRPRRFKPDAA